MSENEMTVKEATGGALAILEQSKWMVLRDPEIRQSLAENLKREAFTTNDLTKVPTPTGGQTKWTFQDLDGEKQVDEITGLCVYYGVGGVVWPKEGQAKVGTRPYLRTDDLITAYKFGDDPGDLPVDEVESCRLPDGTYDWQKLTNSKAGGPFGWGSASQGEGKRAKEYRVICLLRDNDSFPLIFRAGPGSLKTVAPFFKRLTPPWRAIVSLSLRKVQGSVSDYSQIVPKLSGWASKEEGEAVKAIYYEALRSMVTGMVLEPDDN